MRWLVSGVPFLSSSRVVRAGRRDTLQHLRGIAARLSCQYVHSVHNVTLLQEPQIPNVYCVQAVAQRPVESVELELKLRATSGADCSFIDVCTHADCLKCDIISTVLC